MLALLGSLPLIGKLVTGITTAIFDAKVRIVQARTGADKEVASKIVETAAKEATESRARLEVIAGSTILTWLVVIFALPFAIFIWKVVVIDIVLGLGTTDPIKGQVAEWANTIIISIFGASSAMKLGQMWFANRSRD